MFVTMLINPANWEAQSVIRFWNAQRDCPAEFHWQLAELHSKRMIEMCVNGVGDEERSGWPTVKDEESWWENSPKQALH